MRKLIGICIVASVQASLALAQTGIQCERINNLVCQTSSASANNVILTTPRGDVSLVRNANVVTPMADQMMIAGDRVLLGRGSASITLAPACVVAIPESASATIVKIKGVSCVQIDTLSPNAAQTDATSPSISGSQILGAVAAGGLGAGAYFLSQQNKCKLSC